MCRIAGIYDPSSISLGEDIEKMTNVMQRGGPDDVGIYKDANVPLALGHRRLSLIDLTAAGHQPMSDIQKRVEIVFNGEIYNYQEIKDKLTALGQKFYTRTDTEVILNAYLQWGSKCFNLFNGMFAFCLWDKKASEIFLVRDPSGIKPLYYYHESSALYFASEVKAFKQLKKFEEETTWRIHFLTFGHIPEPFTTLKGVEMLRKGCYFKWKISEKKGHIFEYFNYKYGSQTVIKEDAISNIQQEFTASIQRHLISDAPIGVFLSGGIDSSVIALVASQFQRQNLHTLSISFNEKKYSEQKYQLLVVDKLQGKHADYTVIQNDFEESFNDIMEAYDQPSVDGVNTWFISKYAKEAGLKAVLSGLGADELFGGYSTFKRIDTAVLLSKVLGRVFRKMNFSGSSRFNKLSFLGLAGDVGIYLFLRGLYVPSDVAQILDIDERQVYNCLEEVSACYNSLQQLDNRNYVSWLEYNLYMQNQLLRDSDYMSMYHGIEIRTPFLDRELVSATLNIDPKIKYGGKIQKELLVKSFENVLPNEVWNRPKMGFAFPFQNWLKQHHVVKELQNSDNNFIKKSANNFQQGNLNWARMWALVLLNNLN